MTHWGAAGRYLLRQLLDDPAVLLPLYHPLLGHSKEHVRKFAAESISYLLRKLGQRQRAGSNSSSKQFPVVPVNLAPCIYSDLQKSAALGTSMLYVLLQAVVFTA